MKAVVSSRFQPPGEGPSRDLLRDYEPSDGPFSSTSHQPPAKTLLSVTAATDKHCRPGHADQAEKEKILTI